jgi:D-alanine-D-alanine ligase
MTSMFDNDSVALSDSPQTVSLRRSRVLIVYNEPVLSEDHRDAVSEHEVLFTVEAVRGVLKNAGYRTETLGVGNDPSILLTHLRRRRPDMVFNLFEGLGNLGGTEATLAGILDWLRIPYTGCPNSTLCLGRNKAFTKMLLRSAGLPTADFYVVDALPAPEHLLDWPVIVKPATQDASVGVDQGSVVTDPVRLNERIEYLLDQYGPPVMVEEFIPGREFSVALIEAPDMRALPISEILFVDKGEGYWPIVTYDAKWKPGCGEYEATPPRYPAEISPRLEERLTHISKKAFRLLGCRDYARIDFRVKPPSRPYILEINPNPDFSPQAGLAGGLISAGISHEQFTLELVRHTLERAAAPTLTAAAPIREAR